MRLNRRGLLAGAIAGAAMMMASMFSSPAWALTADQAKAHVEATVNELISLLKTPGDAQSRAPRLRTIMETKGNLPQIAQFSAGRVWRDMTPDQQRRYVDAFSRYVSNTYARRFSEYSGNPDITIGRVVDAGNKGFLVQSPIRQPSGQPVMVDWLVSDRGGRVEVVDIIIEGVSMATTQREEIGSMYQRGGSVDALIASLGG